MKAIIKQFFLHGVGNRYIQPLFILYIINGIIIAITIATIDNLIVNFSNLLKGCLIGFEFGLITASTLAYIFFGKDCRNDV